MFGNVLNLNLYPTGLMKILMRKVIKLVFTHSHTTGSPAGCHQALSAPQVFNRQPSAVLHPQAGGGRVRPGEWEQHCPGLCSDAQMFPQAPRRAP